MRGAESSILHRPALNTLIMALFNDDERDQLKKGLVYGGLGNALDIGFGTIGNLFGMPFEIAREKRNYALQYQYNEQAAQNAFNRQVEFWNMQNLYNTPSAQLARLRKAGLNPALMNGGVQGNTAGNLSTVPNASVSNSASTQPAVKLMNFAQMAQMLKEAELLDAQTKDLIQSAALKQIEGIVKSLVGKDEWLEIKDKAKEMGYSLDTDELDEYFGIGKEPSPGGLSPTKIDLENKQSSTELNRQLADESKSKVLLNDAERKTIDALRDNQEALLQAQTAAHEIANELERRYGALQRNGELQLNKAEFEKIRQDVMHEKVLMPFKRKLLNAQVDQATADASLAIIEKEFNQLDYEYLKSWVGQEGNWYDIIGRLIYEITTDVPFSAGVQIGKSK